MQQQFQCPRCNAPVAYGTQFCQNCGNQLHWQQQTPPPTYQKPLNSQQQQGYQDIQNTSGQGNSAIIPPEIKGWNWGAFLLSFWWGIFNRVWITFLGLIPIMNIIMPFILGAKGNEWAWEKNKWDSIEHFQKTQRKWMYWGVGLKVVPVIILLIIFMLDAIYNTPH